MTDLASIIGAELAADLYYQQACDVEAAILENEPGVRRIALAVQNDASLASPTAVFLSRLKRGQHRKPSRAQRATASSGSVVDHAEDAYHHKLASLAEHDALTDTSSDDAIAYAIDYTKGATHDTETALRQRLNLAAYATQPTTATWGDVMQTMKTIP
jgi:hypothetical protein